MEARHHGNNCGRSHMSANLAKNVASCYNTREKLIRRRGIPLSGYEKFLCDLSESTLFMASGECFDENGLPAEPEETGISDYLILEYNNIMGGGDRISGFFRTEK